MTDDTLEVSEVFFSIQGEGTRSGLPCAFVRLAGCDLRCRYCDTAYARGRGERRRIDDVVDQVDGFGCDLVQVTGGEPLLQPGVHLLMGRLCQMGKRVLLETSGACDISSCDPRVVRIMDLKTPGSGEFERNLWANVDQLTDADEVKFVICDRADYEWARQVIGRYDLSNKVAAVLLSPAAESAPPDSPPDPPPDPPPDAPSDVGREEGSAGVRPRQLAEWILADRLSVRLQLQLHRLVWGPHERGV